MAEDPINKFLGRKPLALDLAALGAGDWLVFDTMELVAEFMIPTNGQDFHLVIDLISFSSPAGDAGNEIIFAADFVRDDTEDPPDTFGFTADELSRSANGMWVHVINAANTAVAMTPVDIFNTFALQDFSGSTDSVVMFWHHFEEGGMDWSQENAVDDVEVRQIEAIQGEPGDQYFQIDAPRLRQVFLGGVTA